ncbi:polysaccharide biosynthesis tyrosine autokinase [Blastopirellula marina]|uniref:AAA domain-containing protein n=1 Tax=Blastopirellula marina TaxID=124 RepID=A0A2S8G191_9BACT|nr:polysaccharide biosynthesis tyrosine autokinase [Blastopirellula marina]PQO38080.1 hypothetical protein C5Y98_08325 [Blastopirellula marina]PTL44736.1 hypothetical protein C5Y97_08325 [Blastopirellula marina]
MSLNNANLPQESSKRDIRVDAPVELVTGHANDFLSNNDVESEELGGGGIGVSQILHALRRRWLPAFSIGIVLATAGVALAWVLDVPEYTTRAMLRISSSQGSLLKQDGEKTGDFDVYKLTHRQLLRGPFVINAALRDPEVAKLPVIKEKVDPVSWLQGALSVNFPDNAEIMEVKLSGESPQSISKIVNAVVQAYMDEVVDAEANMRRSRLSSLERAYSETENELRSKRSEFRRLADTLGTGDTASLSLVQQNALQQFAALRSELTRVQLDLLRAKGKLAGIQSSVAANLTEPVVAKKPVVEEEENAPDAKQDVPLEEDSDVELQNILASDEVIAALKSQIMQLEAEILNVEQTAVPGIQEQYVGKYRDTIVELEEHVRLRKDQIVKGRAQWQAANFKASVDKARSEVVLLEQMEKQLVDSVTTFEKEAKQFGRSSIDVEMMRTEIDSLEGILSRLGHEIENTKIELKSDSRVTFFQDAQPPKSKNPRSFAKIGMFGFAGMMIPVAGFVFWDLRSQRINAPSDISKNLRINVLGAIPFVPRSVLVNSSRNSKKQEYWKNLIAESVGGIVARLFRPSATRQYRVVMISSALAGEGKTTLAGQIAYALAESGARTILVDFDLRRPALDTAFDVNLVPGVTEWLSGEVEIQDAIQETGMRNLDIIAAGDWGHNSFRELTSNRMDAFFKKLRQEYDYVIVDGSPILPVVDARLIGQYVDGVVMAVLRDISRGVKVEEARELLNVFNVPFLGAVVVGITKEDVYNYTSQRNRKKQLVHVES